MELENISKKDSLITEGLNAWTDEKGTEYLIKNEVKMDTRMYMSLNSLYLKRKIQQGCQPKI
jgi:hypothetical protein